MTRLDPTSVRQPSSRAREVYLFGIPIGGLGWFSTLLLGAATGFAAFFAGTFLGILGIALVNGVSHASLDFAYAYTRVGLPIGIVVLFMALAFLITLRIRRLGRND